MKKIQTSLSNALCYVAVSGNEIISTNIHERLSSLNAEENPIKQVKDNVTTYNYELAKEYLVLDPLEEDFSQLHNDASIEQLNWLLWYIKEGGSIGPELNLIPGNFIIEVEFKDALPSEKDYLNSLIKFYPMAEGNIIEDFQDDWENT